MAIWIIIGSFQSPFAVSTILAIIVVLLYVVFPVPMLWAVIGGFVSLVAQGCRHIRDLDSHGDHFEHYIIVSMTRNSIEGRHHCSNSIECRHHCSNSVECRHHCSNSVECRHHCRLDFKHAGQTVVHKKLPKSDKNHVSQTSLCIEIDIVIYNQYCNQHSKLISNAMLIIQQQCECLWAYTAGVIIYNR